MADIKGLKILSFNVEGLDSMLTDPTFSDLINKHDICILTETMRNSDAKLNLENFWDDSYIRPKEKKAGRHSGGITILVKSHLRKGVKISHKSEGFLWFRLDKDFFKIPNDLFICAAYIPPQNTSKTILVKTDYFDDLLSTINQFMRKGNVLLAGDFNARIGNENIHEIHDTPIIADLTPPFLNPTSLMERSACDMTINQHGRKLTQICSSLNLHVANGRTPGDLLGNYTCFTNNGVSTVDLVIADNDLIHEVKKLKVLPPEFTSVHAPISMELNCEFQTTRGAETSIPLPPKLVWDPEKVPALRAALLSPANKTVIDNLTLILEDEDTPRDSIDKCLGDFNNLLIKEAKTLMRTTRSTPSRKRMKPKQKGFKWYNSECASMKKRLQNQANLLNKNPKDPYIRGQYNKVKKEYRKTVKLTKQAYEIEAIQTLQAKASNPKDFWAFLKSIDQKSAKIGESNSPSASEWLDHFTTLNSAGPSSETSNIRINEIAQSVRSELDDITDASIPQLRIMEMFCGGEIATGIKALKPGKAVATDLISNDIIKGLSDIVNPFLTALFNKILIHETFPEEWSLGIIIPLFKSGDTTDANCYRGITINSCVSKLFMLLINNRLQEYCDRRGIIHYSQIGFRKNFRSGDHVFTMKTLIDKSLHENKTLHVCFVDFRKAYDTVWRDGLFKKLLSYDVDRRFVRLLRNIYATSSLAVKTQNGRSSIFASNVGLKQGCNLSPLLFNIFINDLLSEIDTHREDSPMLNGIPINGLMYADDLVLISESEEGLQHLLNILNSYTEKWFMQVNKSKTKYMRICKQNRKPLALMKLGDSALENTSEYCYLGTVFTCNGSLNEAGKVLHDKAVKAMYGLLQKVHKHKTCSPKILLELFDKMIIPIAMYNSEVWGTACFPVNERNNDFFDATNKNPIEDIQVRFCKRVLGVHDKSTNWAVTSECGRLPTIMKVMKNMISFWVHLNNSESPILKAALQTSADLSIMKSCRTWYSYLVRVCRFLDIEHILYTADIDEANFHIRKLKQTIHQKALLHWYAKHEKTKLTDHTKLDLFCQLKTKPVMSPHLVYPISFRERQAINKFRTSAHNLPVETGRYLGITDRAQRLCPLCNQGVGDEPHYLT